MANLLTLVADSKRHDDDLKGLREEVEKLSMLIQQLSEGDRRDREQANRWASEDREAEKRNEDLLSWLDAKLLTLEQRGTRPVR